MSRNFKVNTPPLPIADIDEGDSELSLFDQNNPDVNLFNLVDDEIIRLSGSKMHFYKYNRSENFDDVYMEERDKPISIEPILVHGHYEPQAMQENLTQFGMELTNDQVFIFNKSYIEQKLGRLIIPGDRIKPFFQEQRYEIFEVQEDSFEAYGVYHLVCSAKVERTTTEHEDAGLVDPLTTSDELGGYGG